MLKNGCELAPDFELPCIRTASGAGSRTSLTAAADPYFYHRRFHAVAARKRPATLRDLAIHGILASAMRLSCTVPESPGAHAFPRATCPLPFTLLSDEDKSRSGFRCGRSLGIACEGRPS